MSLDYNTRSFAPLANFTEVILALLSKGTHPVIFLPVSPAMGQTEASAGNHHALFAYRASVFMCTEMCVDL